MGSSRLAAAITVLFASAAACASGDRTFERQVPAEAHGVVDISNVSGTVVVTGWDRPEVSVRADLHAGVERVDLSTDHRRTTVQVVVPHSGHGGAAAPPAQGPTDNWLSKPSTAAPGPPP